MGGGSWAGRPGGQTQCLGEETLWENSATSKSRQIPTESTSGTGADGPIVSSLPAPPPPPSTPLAVSPAPRSQGCVSRGAAAGMGKRWGQSRCPTGAPLPWLPRGQSTRPCLVIACPRPPGLSGSSSWAGPGDLGPSIAPASREEPPGLRSRGRVLSPCLGVPSQGLWGCCRGPEARTPCSQPGPRAAGLSWHGPRCCLQQLLSPPWLPVPRKRRPVPFPRVPRWGRSPRAVAPAHPERWHSAASEAAPGPARGDPHPAGHGAPRRGGCAAPVPPGGSPPRRSLHATRAPRLGGAEALADEPSPHVPGPAPPPAPRCPDLRPAPRHTQPPPRAARSRAAEQPLDLPRP